MAAGPCVADPDARLTRETFETVRKLVYDTAGIDLRVGKESLVSARLGRLMRASGHNTYEDCIDEVLTDRSGESLIALIDALTTNYTSFLREPVHFEFLARRILPELSGRRVPLRFWCAASSTGEEPYSMAFVVLESLGPLAAAATRILATDISTRALQQARAAVYPAARFEAIPHPWLSKYLLRGEKESKGLYKVKPDVARMVEFKRLNLVDEFDPGAEFPLISCRNVMIYFDKPTQERIVNRLVRFLEPGGYLFVGLSESLNGISHPLQYVQPAIYRRRGAA